MKQLTREDMVTIRPHSIRHDRPSNVYVVYSDRVTALETADHALIDGLIKKFDMVLTTEYDGRTHFVPRKLLEASELGFHVLPHVNRDYSMTPAEQIIAWRGVVLEMNQLTKENAGMLRPTALYYNDATEYVVTIQGSPAKFTTHDHGVAAELIAAHDMRLVVADGAPHFRPLSLIEGGLKLGYANRNSDITPADQILMWGWLGAE